MTTRPGFSFCICPDGKLLRQQVEELLGAHPDAGRERHVFWGDDELPPKFWEILTLQGLFSTSRVLVMRNAHALTADVWKRLSAALSRPNPQTWPLFCLEVAWEKGQPKIPAHIAKLPCFTFADAKGWIWRSPGLEPRSLRRHIQIRSKALGLETKRVQFTPDTMPSDIIGFSLPEQGRMVYQPGAVMTNLLLADEINRTSSKTQSALLEAMEEGHVTVDGVTHDLPAPFVVLATQNPIGSAGTQNLPNSQLDRFLMKLSMGYPDVGSQVRILRERSQQEPLEQVEPVMCREELLTAIAKVRQVHVDDQIYDYIARLAEVTRTHPLLKLGISPRGALALCRTAKARAFAEGRDFVVPEDVTQMAEYVFAHRLMLSSKARLNEYTPEAIVAEVLAQTQPPVLSERRA